MPLSTQLRSLRPFELAAIAFYAVTGIILLAFLPSTGFPPHLGFLGILSIITAYSLFEKRVWAHWLVAILFVTITAFAISTLYSIGFSNALLALTMILYAVLTWVFTAYIILKRKD